MYQIMQLSIHALGPGVKQMDEQTDGQTTGIDA